jgi:DUF1680 family protein
MNISCRGLASSSRIGRRSFMQSALASMLAATSFRAAQTDFPKPEVVAVGEIARRMELTRQRFLIGKTPSYSREMVLADVALAPQRRFVEFSGDISGRFIEALSVSPIGPLAGLDRIMEKLLSCQGEDGRFGNAKLIFRSDAIGPDHMALLWGNGRLLIGLMRYYQIRQEARVLNAARRLGNFLLTVEQECSNEEVRRRLQGQGANGFICFTQLVEGWVRLASATQDKKYLDAGRKVMPLLGERGIQHAHGYLATLRGFLDLAESLKDPTILRQVEGSYQDLLSAPDYTVFGSVLEYFGWENQAFKEEDLKRLKAASGEDPRDEGCGHADFLRLSLSLWRRTGQIEYLERAERCLLNGLLPNQFATGDYGSRSTFSAGLKPTNNVDRAWWCCTMHGYRAIPDLLESIITETADTLRLNLFEELDWKKEGWALSLRARGMNTKGKWVCHLMVKATGGIRQFAIRQPCWADPIHLRLNGGAIPSEVRDGYVLVSRDWKVNDQLEIQLHCLPRFQLRDGRMVKLEEFPSGVSEAALHLGPWLMGVDEADEPLFFGEPWPGNTLELPFSILPIQSIPTIPAALPQIDFSYVHEGFFGQEKVTLNPIRDYGLRPQRILAVWLRFRKT